MSTSRTTNLPARVVAAILLIVATVVHVMVAVGGGGLLGILFWLSALGTLVGAILLFASPRWGWIVGGVVAALTALGYILRSTVGLPPLIPNPVSFTRPVSGVVSVVAEILVVILAVWALSGARARVNA